MPPDDSYSEERTPPTPEILNALSTLNTNNPVNIESQEQPQPPVPPSDYDLLNKQVADNPHDNEAWRRLIDVAEASGDIDKISATYDAVLKQFPNTVCLPPLTRPFDMSESFFFLDMSAGTNSDPVHKPFHDQGVYV